MKKCLNFISLLTISLSLVSCQNEGEPTQKSKEAYAQVNPLKNSGVTGYVTFKQVDNGVLIKGDVKGLSPGKHGFHIHEYGDCNSPDGKSAGGHFNPTKKKHGGPNDQERHVGDLGNLDADQNGFAHYERVDSVIELQGPNSIIGKSIIIHSDSDDFTTQPTGNAGSRLGCGIIIESQK